MLGIIAQKLGEYETAIDAYRMALNLQPDMPETHQGLAVAYESLGDVTMAHSHWEKYLELVADNPLYQEEARQISAKLIELAALTKTLNPGATPGSPSGF